MQTHDFSQSSKRERTYKHTFFNERMQIYIVRHGQASHNVKKVLDENPKHKTNLTPKGIRQVQNRAEQLKHIPLDIIFTSQFPRALQTARIINNYHYVNLKSDRRLNERKTGMDQQPIRKWKKISKKNNFQIKLPRGESFQEEKKRLRLFLSSLKKMPYRHVLVVTHSEPLQIILGLLKNFSDQEMMKIKPRNAQLFMHVLKK